MHACGEMRRARSFYKIFFALSLCAPLACGFAVRNPVFGSGLSGLGWLRTIQFGKFMLEHIEELSGNIFTRWIQIVQFFWIVGEIIEFDQFGVIF